MINPLYRCSHSASITLKQDGFTFYPEKSKYIHNYYKNVCIHVHIHVYVYIRITWKPLSSKLVCVCVCVIHFQSGKESK